MQSDLIVSVASFEARLALLPRVVETFFAQTVKPSLVVIWLGNDLNDERGAQVARELARLGNAEVRYTEDTRSYKKLLPSLVAFPDAVIVTADDDMLMPDDWLAGLHAAHLKMPKAILCNRARKIRCAEDGGFLDYMSWGVINNNEQAGPSFFVLPTGNGGILYPPNALSLRVHDDALRQKAATADDLFFKAMAILQGTPAVKVRRTGEKRIRPLRVESKLWQINQRTNDTQWQALDAALGLREMMLRKEEELTGRA